MLMKKKKKNKKKKRKEKKQRGAAENRAHGPDLRHPQCLGSTLRGLRLSGGSARARALGALRAGNCGL